MNNKTKNDKKIKEKVSSLEEKIKSLEQEKEELEAKIKFYEEQFRLSKSKQYGKSSEKSDPDQMTMFNEAEKLSVKEAEEPEIEEILVKRKKGLSKSRKTYDDLPVEEIYYDISDEEKECPKCGNELHEMKVTKRKELKIIPPKVIVVHHIQRHYACRKCDKEGIDGGTIVAAKVPNPILPGSMLSPSMLSFTMTQKYDLAMPLYRQEMAFKNIGIDISRQKLAQWTIVGAEKWLTPLYDRLHFHLLKEPVIHADESPFKVIDEKQKSKCYMWLYASSAMGDNSIYLYDYKPSRSKKNPKEFLEGFKGYLQTDGYSGYNGIPNVIRVGCLAHARRKFVDAANALPAEVKKAKNSDAHVAIDKIGKLYVLEKEFKKQGLSPDQIYEERLEKSKPLLDELHVWLTKKSKTVLPKGLFGKAIAYSLKQWGLLSNYLLDGHIAIDNNLAERAIKPFVIGRKNYLFAKSPKGASASAVCYSVIETAKANGLNVFEYLTYLFEKLPNIDIENLEDLDALLPWAKTLPDDLKVKPNDEN